MDANGDDPFASLAHFCTLSDSQEEFLRRCPFAGDPKSLDASAFSEQSAPAGGAEVVVRGGSIGAATAVDLGKDTDLGFQLEAQSTQRIGEIENVEIVESEPASKRLKLSKEALGEKLLVDLDSAKSGEESKLMDEMTEELATETNGVADGKVSNGDNWEETRCDNNEKFAEKEGRVNRDQSSRVLPSSINGAKETDATPFGDSGGPVSILLEILKILGDEESEEDDSLANLSILDIVMRRGMTFPRPCWWPEGQDFSFK